MSHAQDHFSAIAGDYTRGRFCYPSALFDFLAGLCPARTSAWDCATGSGQAATALAARFTQVVATDVSEALLAQAPAIANVQYQLAPAEASGLASASVDLITVAQALHWFDLDLFWRELARVGRPGAVFAFWGYLWPQVNLSVDARLADLQAVLAPYWPARSILLHQEYRSVYPPFPEIACPLFWIEAQWTRQDYCAHLASWSAVRHYREKRGGDIVGDFDRRLESVWSDEQVLMTRWPLVLRVARIG